MSDPFNGEELEFPLRCHYRIITENIEGIELRLLDALVVLGIQEKPQAGNRSKGGKYLTFFVDLFIESREVMDEVDQALRSVQGVRMVL